MLPSLLADGARGQLRERRRGLRLGKALPALRHLPTDLGETLQAMSVR